MSNKLIRNVISNYLKNASESSQLEKGIEIEKEHTDVYELMLMGDQAKICILMNAKN